MNSSLVFGQRGRWTPFLLAVFLVPACSDSTRSFGGDAGVTGGRSGSGSGGATGSGGRGGNAGSGGSAGIAGGTGGPAIGTGGRSATGGAGGRAGSAGATGGTRGTGGNPGTGGAGGGCVLAATCGLGRNCCSSACSNPMNDPFNCGGCGTRCAGAAPYCGSGRCQATPCERDGAACGVGGTCCGSSCCAADQICCDPQGPISTGPTCTSPAPGSVATCPPGCAPLCVSDRALKKDIVPADAMDVLAKVERLPISTWSYITEPGHVRHLGPMAQDFRASFGLGADDRTYNSVDAHGVSLAAIQALDRLVVEQQKRIDALEQANQNLSRRLQTIEGRAARGHAPSRDPVTPSK
jgi:hypothetical protein